jgi:hypothetical protein
MSHERAISRLALAALALAWIVATGCATRREAVPRALPEGEARAAGTGAGVRIHGYTTWDGVHHPFRGRARAIGDSIEFERPHQGRWGLAREQPATRFRVHRDSVAMFQTTDPVATGLVTVGVAVLLASAAFVGMAASAFDNDPYF